MTTIIATIKKRHLDNIRRGIKKWEVRKTVPKRGAPFKVLCCESGSGGIIKAEFICDYVEEEHTADVPQMVKEACLTQMEALNYSKDCLVYFWHISNVVECEYLYMQKKISEFGLKRAPQSWQYVK